MNKRNVSTPLTEALADVPAVFLRGARQTGKTTLVKALCRDGGRSYLTLDSATALAAALDDPVGLVRGLAGPAVIDEVQRAPGLVLAIKEAVDNDRRPGQWLLTGSANALVLPRVADSLAGRLEVLTLHPFSQGELAGQKDDFIARLFGAQRQASWSATEVSLYHYRSQSGDEVDLVLEDRAGRVAAVEVKLGETLDGREAKGLIHMREALGDRFAHGAILYAGANLLPLGDRIFAVPLGELFSA
jgi:predicted AAA+ superfamily ATPase